LSQLVLPPKEQPAMAKKLDVVIATSLKELGYGC